MTLSVQLSHRFGDFALDLAFEAPPGVTVLFGKSGAGKSSVVQAVAGLLRPDQGRIALEGEVLLDTAARRFVPPHRRRIGYVFQDARLFPHLSLRQNLFYGRWFNRSARQHPEGAVLEMLGLTPLLARRVADLSGGEAARVGLGRALLSGPRMLLLDEPLAALDGARRAEVLPYLERLRDELRLPMLYVTHSPAEALRLATSVVLLEGGRVAAAGAPEAVFLSTAAAGALGPAATGAVLQARLSGLAEDGLLQFDTAAGPGWLPAEAVGGLPTAGRAIRVRVLAEDVLISLAPPSGLSALNVWPGTVEGLEETGGAVLVRLRLAGGEGLLARLTRRSVKALALRPGLSVHAVAKSVRLARDD